MIEYKIVFLYTITSVAFFFINVCSIIFNKTNKNHASKMINIFIEFVQSLVNNFYPFGYGIAFSLKNWCIVCKFDLSFFEPSVKFTPEMKSNLACSNFMTILLLLALLTLELLPFSLSCPILFPSCP